jgi:hypothetical protein
MFDEKVRDILKFTPRSLWLPNIFFGDKQNESKLQYISGIPLANYPQAKLS